MTKTRIPLLAQTLRVQGRIVWVKLAIIGFSAGMSLFFARIPVTSGADHLDAPERDALHSSSSLPAVPSQLVLTVSETAGVARTGELVRSGVPLPRSLNVRNPVTLTLVDAGNTPVPADFQVLARWNAGLSDTTALIQWLLVTFRATVAANSRSTYRVVTDGSAGSNPSPTVRVQVTQSGNKVTVNTGAAIFVLGGNASALFEEIRLFSGTRLVSGGDLTAIANSANVTHPTTRSVTIEYAGPLSAIVTVNGVYSMANIGGGGLGSVRRYVFSAGSPTAIVRHAVNWEGDLCGNGVILCGGSPNAVHMQRVRDTLTLDLSSPLAVTAVGSFNAAAVTGNLVTGQEASVRQLLRASRTAPLAFSVSVPGTGGSTGVKADGGMLAASGTTGTVAIALMRMHRYEPQALRLLADGRLAVDLADDQAWLGMRQGLFATLAVSALDSKPTRADLDRQVWAPLNHPVHAWAEPAWFAASEAVDEFPVGTLPANLADYAKLMSDTLTSTLDKVDQKGMAGLMTFGVYPRIWGNVLYSDELDCDGQDPTPGDTWDNAYWCGSWTDYHSATTTATFWAMRSGEVKWLDEIAFPAALRVLHTQIMQCSPNDTYFYCGQSPAGYGGYRENFNGSHAYFENLLLYYWLTGDYTVVETLKRGASSMRDYLCSRRPGAACLPDDKPADLYAGLTGRVAMQWFAVFRFVGLTSNDSTYLDDYRPGLARTVTQYYVEAKQNATSYGFLLDDLVDGPGTDTTGQLWFVSLYDMNMLYRLKVDTNDAPIGNPAIPPSQVLAGWARTLARFGATVSGDGTVRGNWPNQLDFTWTGNRIGGTLTTVQANLGGGDPLLYNTGKATLTGVMMRAGNQTGDAELTKMGADLTELALSAAKNEFLPLSKIHAEYFVRLHPAVARIAGAQAPPNFSITMSKSSYQSGDTITASEFRIKNQGSAMVKVNLRIWLRVPTVGEVTLISVGSDGSFSLPANIDVNLGPVSLISVTPTFPPRGNWEFNSRMGDPTSGTLLSEDINVFVVQ